jgi:hypothetical protein
VGSGDQAKVLPVASLAQNTIVPSTQLLAIGQPIHGFGRTPRRRQEMEGDPASTQQTDGQLPSSIGSVTGEGGQTEKKGRMAQGLMKENGTRWGAAFKPSSGTVDSAASQRVQQPRWACGQATGSPWPRVVSPPSSDSRSCRHEQPGGKARLSSGGPPPPGLLISPVSIAP